MLLLRSDHNLSGDSVEKDLNFTRVRDIMYTLVVSDRRHKPPSLEM